MHVDHALPLPSQIAQVWSSLWERVDGELAFEMCTDVEAEALQTAAGSDQVWPTTIERKCWECHGAYETTLYFKVHGWAQNLK